MEVVFRKLYSNQGSPDDPNNANYAERERIIKRVHAKKTGSQFGIYTPAGTPFEKIRKS